MGAGRGVPRRRCGRSGGCCAAGSATRCWRCYFGGAASTAIPRSLLSLVVLLARGRRQRAVRARCVAAVAAGALAGGDARTSWRSSRCSPCWSWVQGQVAVPGGARRRLRVGAVRRRHPDRLPGQAGRRGRRRRHAGEQPVRVRRRGQPADGRADLRRPRPPGAHHVRQRLGPVLVPRGHASRGRSSAGRTPTGAPAGTSTRCRARRRRAFTYDDSGAAGAARGHQPDDPAVAVRQGARARRAADADDRRGRTGRDAEPERRPPEARAARRRPPRRAPPGRMATWERSQRCECRPADARGGAPCPRPGSPCSTAACCSSWARRRACSPRARRTPRTPAPTTSRHPTDLAAAGRADDLPRRVRLGRGDVGVPGRGVDDGRRTRPVDLGHVRRDARAHPTTARPATRPPTTTGSGSRTSTCIKSTSACPRTGSRSRGRASSRRARARSNQEGVDFYRRLVDGLLRARHPPRDHAVPLGPAAAAAGRGRLGGPRHRRPVRASTPAVVFDALRDVDATWLTINEPKTTAFVGYRWGSARAGDQRRRPGAPRPSTTSCSRTAWRCRRSAPAAPRAASASRSTCCRSTRSSRAAEPRPRRVDGVENRLFLDPVLLGALPGRRHRRRSRPAPRRPGAFDALVQDGDLDAIGAPLDVLAVQYYGVTGVDDGGEPGRRSTRRRRPPGSRCTPRACTTCSSDLLIDYPDAPPLVITENGIPDPTPEGTADDPDRLEFLRAHLQQAARAIGDGVRPDAATTRGRCWTTSSGPRA